jgi:hypothetical protein
MHIYLYHIVCMYLCMYVCMCINLHHSKYVYKSLSYSIYIYIYIYILCCSDLINNPQFPNECLIPCKYVLPQGSLYSVNGIQMVLFSMYAHISVSYSMYVCMYINHHSKYVYKSLSCSMYVYKSVC